MRCLFKGIISAFSLTPGDAATLRAACRYFIIDYIDVAISLISLIFI